MNKYLTHNQLAIHAMSFGTRVKASFRIAKKGVVSFGQAFYTTAEWAGYSFNIKRFFYSIIPLLANTN